MTKLDRLGGVGAARQQPGIEHDVGDVAAGAERPVRAHPDQRAVQVADRALAGVPHGRSGWPQSGQPSLRRASAILAAAVSKTSIIVHPATIVPAVSSGQGAAGVAAWHLTAARATRAP